MIDVYTMLTPNGIKPIILLEELGVPYKAHKINIMDGDQFKPEFVAVSPNSKIPAIVDQKGPGNAPLSVFESGAILTYLAEKFGHFLPKDPAGRATTLQWVFWQVGSVGPMFGQAGHFVRFAKEDVPYAKKRYTDEVKRLLKVAEDQLENHPYLAGEQYSIADMMTVPWFGALDFYGIAELLAEVPRVKAWMEAVESRPAVQRARNVNFID